VRDIQAVVATEGDEEVVTRDTGDGLRLEAEQPPDAVVLVDDVIARAQVRERLECSSDARRPRGAAAEDLRFGNERDAQLAPHEALPSRRNGEQENAVVGQARRRLLHPSVSTAQELLRP
jgi:hypothetical protein